MFPARKYQGFHELRERKTQDSRPDRDGLPLAHKFQRL